MGNTFIGYNNKVTDGGVFVTARSFTRERPLKDIRFRGKTWPYIPQSKVLEVVNITLSAIVEKKLEAPQLHMCNDNTDRNRNTEVEGKYIFTYSLAFSLCEGESMTGEHGGEERRKRRLK